MTSTTKLEISLPTETIERYEEIALSMGEKNTKEVFRKAVLTLALLHEEAKNGAEIVLKQPDGTSEKLNLFPKIAG